ncbi:MAG TPA: hypothetical protein VES42_01940 [Pilimelia sp.]|nr:hypothetical protein [Pilimelia sp.]
MTEDPNRGQAQVPKPPSREEVEEISRAQEFLTDDWTGDGGKPKDEETKGRPPGGPFSWLGPTEPGRS